MKSSYLKKVFIYCISSALIIVSFSYLFFLYGLPKLVNSKTFANKLQQIVYKKTNINLSFDNIKLITQPNFSADLYVKNISAFSNNKEKIFASDNLYIGFDIIRPTLNTFCADYIYFDKPAYSKIMSPAKKSGKKETHLESFPYIVVKKADIIVENNDKNQISLVVSRFNVVPYDGQIVSDASIDINSNIYKEKITLRGKGQLHINNNVIKTNKYELKYGIANFIVSGKLWDKRKNYDINVKAENLPVNLLEKSFLALMKQKNPQKNFIENFYDFGGLANLDLNIKPKSLVGTSKISNLTAKTVKFSIPINLPSIIFIFDKDKISAKTTGYFGGEKTYTDFYESNIFYK